MDGLRKRFEKYKYPLLVLIVGAVLMLLPSGGSTKEQPTPTRAWRSFWKAWRASAS